jgi:GH15 family glucan-1,4-alpha-glucosidase
MYKDIRDYGLIGDMHSVALVSADGSIDYCSMPHIDSPTVFAALLDDEKGGYFSIQPQQAFESTQEYLEDTNILSCRFRIPDAQAVLIDFMPVDTEELFEKKEHIIHRCLSVTSGVMNFVLKFFPRPQYGRGPVHIEKKEHFFRVISQKERFTLALKTPSYEIKKATTAGLIIRIALKQGQTAHFDFMYGDKDSPELPLCSFHRTHRFWQKWLHNCAGERCLSLGPYEKMLNRSILTLKLLTFQPTGAIAAAATTSLPESIGYSRNWDYRFTWIRDASFTLKAMFNLGHIQEADSFIHWLQGIYHRYASSKLQIMYSLQGQSRLKERILAHLKGYRNSRPVRVGNAAYLQNQWDIYGEVMDAALRLSDYAGRINEDLWPFFRDICKLAICNWRSPDCGIWEFRGRKLHFVYSKVMCWVALDRGIKIARRYGFDAPLEQWHRERDKIKEDILQQGYNKQIRSFVQYYGSRQLDASLLLLALFNFLPVDDERIRTTVQSCKDNLMKDGFLLRYSGPDGLNGREGGFLLCNFWLIEYLALADKIEEAQNLLALTTKAANHLGLFSEEYDFNNKKMLGNFPQAFSHIGYINAALAILGASIKSQQTKPTPLLKRMHKLIPFKVVLNKTYVRYSNTPADIAAQLKIMLGRLQGAFFDVPQSRVDYDSMKKSQSYQEYLELAKKLNYFDVFILKDDAEKKAFWINIYNILIIHGVIELQVRDCVKEIFNFFGRIGYNIGGLYFSADDIEHGILRANNFHPVLHKRQFLPFDKRKALCIRRADPRIHFALVCAASSCPPIEFYTAQQIDTQLDSAGRSFLNRGGIVLQEDRHIVYLSQIFKWYAKDFGATQEAVLEFILQFANAQTKDYIHRNKDKIRIRYSPYNWDLNKALR